MVILDPPDLPRGMRWAAERDRLQRVLASNVRRLRLENGWTVEGAAEEGALAVRNWQQIEAAEQNVTLETLAKLSAASLLSAHAAGDHV